MRSKRWISNASPLILLGKIGCLDLLASLAPSLAVPQSVIREIEGGLEDDASVATVITWAKARAVDDMSVPASVASWDLGAGESQVLSYCLATPSVAVLDDGKARACAQTHGIALIGTLSVILRARRLGLIAAARPLVDQLLIAGSYLDRDLVRAALAQVGEDDSPTAEEEAS